MVHCKLVKSMDVKKNPRHGDPNLMLVDLTLMSASHLEEGFCFVFGFWHVSRLYRLEFYFSWKIILSYRDLLLVAPIIFGRSSTPLRFGLADIC